MHLIDQEEISIVESGLAQNMRYSGQAGSDGLICNKETDMPTLPKILIVEDEDILAENLKVFLGRRYPEVRIALDAEQALKMLKSFEPDIVVMDLVLPGIDGFKAYSEILHRCKRKIGCVMITGHSIENLVERASAQGIRHVLCKPFPLIELQSLVDKSTEEYFDEMRLSVQGNPASRSPGGILHRQSLCRHVIEFIYTFAAVPVT